MSDLIKPQLSDSKDCPCALHPVHQKIPTRTAQIGDNITIRRALPHADRRMIGAWCFLDHFGPLSLKNTAGLSIAPHPHMGLQTFTWTLQGEILHRDSLATASTAAAMMNPFFRKLCQGRSRELNPALWSHSPACCLYTTAADVISK